MAENLFMQNVRAKGLIDRRDIAYAANITCTNGNRGRAWLLLNGSTLYLYEVAGFSDLGELVEVLELKNAQVLKSSSFILNTYIKLQYNGHIYTIKDFAGGKKVIEALKESCGA